MAVEMMQGVLDFGAGALMLGVSLLLEIELLWEHAPGVAVSLQDFTELEIPARRKMALLIWGYLLLLLTGWRLLGRRPKRQRLSLRK